MANTGSILDYTANVLPNNVQNPTYKWELTGTDNVIITNDEDSIAKILWGNKAGTFNLKVTTTCDCNSIEDTVQQQVFIYDVERCDNQAIGEVSCLNNNFSGGEIVRGLNGVCYEIIGLSNQTDANTEIDEEYINCTECLNAPLPLINLLTFTDDIWGVAHGGGGHHYLKLYVIVTGYNSSNTLTYILNGSNLGIFNIPNRDNFSFKLAHSNCCGNIGCGEVVTVEERTTGGTLVQTATAPAVELCSTQDLYSNQNPIILSCSVTAGTNVPIQIQSIPVLANYEIQIFLDGDDTFTPLASAITNNLGQATVILPVATNGATYWVSQKGNGLKESFGNSFTVGGGCTNLVLNPTLVCSVGGVNVTFAPTGGSGTYSYSFNNNDIGGYFPLTTIFLSNGKHQVFVKDSNNADYKVMYTLEVNC